MNNGNPCPICTLEEKIGYVFKNKKYIYTALTHSSYSNETKGRQEERECNERLEFLGDSVLSFITSGYLYENYPSLPEGEMSRIRASAVCEKTLSVFARAVDLGEYLFLGRGEASQNGKNRPSILADAFEALLAAIYLDGGIENVKTFLLPLISEEIKNTVATGADFDYKTVLQQFIQQERGSLLEYVTIDESGPAHAKTFTAQVKLNGNVIGQGSGSSKRRAEQGAAKEALNLFDFKEQ